MLRLTVVLITLLASPAFAASGPFISLRNTNFVVTIAFAIFIGIVLYLGVPKMLGELVGRTRCCVFEAELDEAKSLTGRGEGIVGLL